MYLAPEMHVLSLRHPDLLIARYDVVVTARTCVLWVDPINVSIK